MSKGLRRFLWFVLGAAGTAVTLAVLYALLAGAQSSKDGAATVAAVRETQVSNHALLRQIESLSHRIDDCTKPKGKCHQRAARQTGAAITKINQRGTAQAACQVVLSRQPGMGTARELYEAINRCATDTLRLLEQQRSAR